MNVQDLEPRIIFEDKHVLVVDKPAGLLSQGDSTEDTSLVEWARRYLARHYVGLIHRLDRNTSGIMILAKRSKAAARLTAALQRGDIERSYLVYFIGEIRKKMTWRNWIKKDEAANTAYESSPDHAGAREAILSLEPLKSRRLGVEKITLCKVRLETGRGHQIRIQGAINGHPVLGDTKYGDFREVSWSRAFGRPAIHSSELTFPHPMTEEKKHFMAALPLDMARLSESIFQ